VEPRRNGRLEKRGIAPDFKTLPTADDLGNGRAEINATKQLLFAAIRG